MEMFDQNSVKLRDEFEEKIDYEKYTPKCTRADLNKMIDYDAYKGRSKLNNVESKVKRIYSATNTLPMSYNKLIKEIQEPQIVFSNQEKPLRPVTSQLQRQQVEMRQRPITSTKQYKKSIPTKFQLLQNRENQNITDPYQVLLENNEMTEEELQIQKLYESSEDYGDDEILKQRMLNKLGRINELTQYNQKKSDKLIKLDPIQRPPNQQSQQQQQKALNQQEFQNFLNDQKLQTLNHDKQQVQQIQAKEEDN
eukprot:TRINITY_DN48720_c0_g1_i1.p1 TRINITY_DN48720_c0_g1~~TRINITY_DN48720_c0_g1_i1.p1  ORF type:complete len:252 (-),score=43.15 TRINITY_DN48720_c0_g1_i1:48-803(-)